MNWLSPDTFRAGLDTDRFLLASTEEMFRGLTNDDHGAAYYYREPRLVIFNLDDQKATGTDEQKADRWRDTVVHECRHATVHQDHLRDGVDSIAPRTGFEYMSRVRDAIRDGVMFKLAPEQEKRFEEAAGLMTRQFVDWQGEPGWAPHFSKTYGVPVTESREGSKLRYFVQLPHAPKERALLLKQLLRDMVDSVFAMYEGFAAEVDGPKKSEYLAAEFDAALHGLMGREAAPVLMDALVPRTTSALPRDDL